MANPDTINTFEDSSRRLQEAFRGNIGVESNIFSGPRVAINDHDVTLTHRSRTDESFLRLAAKDQVRVAQKEAVEEEILVAHVMESAAITKKDPSAVPVWQRKLAFSTERKTWKHQMESRCDAIASELAAHAADFDETRTCMETGADEAAAEFRTFKGELVNVVDDFKTWVATESAVLDGIVLDGEHGITVGNVSTIVNIVKKATHPEVKTQFDALRKASTNLRAFVRNLQKSCAKADKPNLPRGKAAKRSEAKLANLLVTAASKEFAFETTNVKKEFASFSDQGESVAVFLEGPEITLMIEAVRDMKYTQSIMKAHDKSMKKFKQTFQTAHFAQKAKVSELKRHINSGAKAGEHLLRRFCTEEGNSEKVFQFELFRHSEEFHSVAVNPFGFPEARAYLCGKAAIVGVKIGSITGGTLREKYAFLYQMDMDDFLVLARRDGFLFDLSVEDSPGLLLLPFGYIIVELNVGEITEGLRWSFSPPDEQVYEKIHPIQQQVAASFPEVQTLTFQSIAKLCMPSGN